jgi:molybdopterin molybdotransferase
MISLDKALTIVLDTEVQKTIERIELHQSLGRYLAEDIKSDINMPPFNKAAMDGFAIRECDIQKELTIIETIAAGQTPVKKIEEGQASKIMTGAPVPEGADFVIQVELSEMVSDQIVKFNGHPRNNIIPTAEDVSVGDVVLEKGQKIDARHIAVLASVGCSDLLVFTQPIVGIISTGDEIVEPNIKPNPSQIRNSNGHQLVAQVIQSHAEAKYFGIVKDDYQATYNAIKKGIETCDILLLTGGVSMGEFDFVPQIMADLGITIMFDRVAVQPGKPTTFGKKENQIIFGLPGNPVSSFVQFEILVKPLIHKFLGGPFKKTEIKLPLGKPYKRKKSERRAYIPVSISEDSKVFTLDYHGSAHIYALPSAIGLAIIYEGITELNEGDLVDVRLF